MSAELGFNTYVLLGNALNYLVNSARVDSEAQLGVPAAAIASLYRKIDPPDAPGDSSRHRGVPA
jgi:hypothetical protein